eukprot:6195628-Pleurochrysis_carterae.AAC.2
MHTRVHAFRSPQACFSPLQQVFALVFVLVGAASAAKGLGVGEGEARRDARPVRAHERRASYV